MGRQGRALWVAAVGSIAAWIAFALAPAAAASRPPSVLELGVVKAINAARADPSAYADGRRRDESSDRTAGWR